MYVLLENVFNWLIKGDLPKLLGYSKTHKKHEDPMTLQPRPIFLHFSTSLRGIFPMEYFMKMILIFIMSTPEDVLFKKWRAEQCALLLQILRTSIDILLPKFSNVFSTESSKFLGYPKGYKKKHWSLMA